eukprot:GHVU01087210.1.p2 GENE.GHVU01087210.1~~GHVU01087210.1.p2  ORF type:complete len:239 (-),score=51.34 GHVU01087210.1:239-955(-)
MNLHSWGSSHRLLTHPFLTAPTFSCGDTTAMAGATTTAAAVGDAAGGGVAVDTAAINGCVFVAVFRTPFKSMTDMAAYFSGLQPDDQTDLISLLLSCRKLEKQLDEQQVVIDMLEHDLRQAQETLRFPPEWKDLEVLDLSGLTTKDKAELPPSDLPLFLKGRVLLQQKEAALAKEQMAGKEAKKAEPSGATQVAKSGMPTLKLGGGAGGGTPGTISKPSAAIGVPRKMPGGLKPKFAM